jgi:hypothetical protein
MLPATLAFPKQGPMTVHPLLGLWRDEDRDGYPGNGMSLKELRSQVMYVFLLQTTQESHLFFSEPSAAWLCCFGVFRTVANALDIMFQKGDWIAMPCNAVAIYLAIILGVFVVLSVADSFAPREIGSRVHWYLKSSGNFY